MTLFCLLHVPSRLVSGCTFNFMFSYTNVINCVETMHQFGVLHEPIDSKRDGPSQFYRTDHCSITVSNLNPVSSE